MSIKEVTDLINQVGVPVAVMLMFAFALWKIIQWCGRRIELWGEPVIKAHLGFIAKVESSIDKQDHLAEKFDLVLQSQGSLLQQLGAVLTQQSAILQEHSKVLETLLKESAVKMEMLKENNNILKKMNGK